MAVSESGLAEVLPLPAGQAGLPGPGAEADRGRASRAGFLAMAGGEGVDGCRLAAAAVDPSGLFVVTVRGGGAGGGEGGGG